jgi:hypothetical protein
LALIGNYSVFNRTPGRNISGATYSQTRSNFNSNSSNRNAIVSFGNFVSLPLGYNHPYSWAMAEVQGGMASFTTISGIISNTSILALGSNITSDITATISTTNLQLDLLVFLMSSLSATGSLSSADLSTLQNIQSNISASGSITSADLGILAIISLQTSMAAGISLTDAQLGALISLES